MTAHSCGMARVIALAAHQAAHRAPRLEMLRSLIVAGCAMALILAKAPLPL
ncbi:hypothetical protein [Novosphingobium beihaiensis]|uniref:Uncharacterized protein n=1 Tax=Novosphingobium beihaiensis TaxID=2930389 RepID=A0ABT0BU58_9SPHN|nr:hypothetical protein [Novosphingobium beihaiensis]MCJ2188574.1 hypothetical protein [Novosphingobium beihaiensis]